MSRAEASRRTRGGGSQDRLQAKSLTANTLMIDIPECLSGLDRDRRGYPVPVTAAVDGNGNPHFTVTDQSARHVMIEEDRCHLSGWKLMRGRWFVGGPMPAFHQFGAFIDGPMLDEASLFAVRTCPYIAAPRYSRRIEDTVFSMAAPDGSQLMRTHDEMVSDRPELFVRVMTTGQKLVTSNTGDTLFVTRKPYVRVEFWQHGQQLDFAKGVELSVASSGGELTTRDVLKACGKLKT
jgi:hypothetical protein